MVRVRMRERFCRSPRLLRAHQTGFRAVCGFKASTRVLARPINDGGTGVAVKCPEILSVPTDYMLFLLCLTAFLIATRRHRGSLLRAPVFAHKYSNLIIHFCAHCHRLRSEPVCKSVRHALRHVPVRSGFINVRHP